MFIDDCITLLIGVVEVMTTNSHSLQLRQDFEPDPTYPNQITMKYLPSNQGREFTGAVLSDYCQWNSVSQELKVTYSTHQNGTTECRRRTLMSATRCMMDGCRLLQSKWDTVFHTAGYLGN